MNIRTGLKGLMAAAVLAGIVSCGGGGGGSSSPTYTVGGTVAGSAGNVVLQINGAGNLTTTGPGAFTFAGPLSSGASYTVTVSSAVQNCSVTNGTGTVSASNITNVFVSCTTVVRSATLGGGSENPAVATAAAGRGAVIVNPTTKEITGGITFSGLTPTAGGHHIHQAPAGNATANGPVIIGLTLAADGSTATVPPGTTLTDAQYAALLAGELYMNVHTAANPSGEIRGQLTGTTGVTAALATLNSAQEVPANASTATGRGTLVFDSTSLDIVIAYVTHNVTGTTVAHIHTGAPGVNGPANVVTLTQGPNIYTAPNPARLTTQNVTDLRAGNLYFNVHSAANPGGEIRGQVSLQ